MDAGAHVGMVLAVTPEQTRYIAHRYQGQLAIVQARTMAAARSAFAGLDGYDREHVAEYERRIRPAMTAGKVAAVRLATGTAALLLGRAAPAIDPAKVPVELEARGPFLQMWHAFSEGRPYVEALAAGLGRAEDDASDLVVSSGRLGVGLASEGHERFVRVPEPDACDWCEMVAEQTYSSADAADFGHGRCACAVVPDTGDE